MFYDVEFDKEYTLKEFFDFILTNKLDEWGSVSISEKEESFYFCETVFEYNRGELKTLKLSEDELSKKIGVARANGGYSLMNYYVTILPS